MIKKLIRQWLGVEQSFEGRSLEDPSVPLSAANLEMFGSQGSYTAGDAGVAVNMKSVLGYAPLHQAVSMISGDVAKLPLNVYRRTEQGRKVQTQHPTQKVIHLKAMANSEINAYKFWRRYMAQALLWGNGYAWIDRNGRGEVIGLYNLLPDRTAPVRYKGELWFITEVGGQPEAFRSSDILHIEGLSIDGLCGENVVKAFREDFQIALNSRRFKAKFFKNNMQAGGFLTVPPNAKPEAVRKVKTKIEEKFSASEAAFKTIGLRDGYKWFSTQIDPAKAQLIEADEQQARNVARMYNLNPSRLGVQGSTSYNSDEMAQKDYHNCALSHWLIGNVAETNNKLLSPQERDQEFYTDYLINAMLWADAKVRSEIANTGIINGRFSPNETRGWENLDDYEGGDTYYQPLNVMPVGTDPNAVRSNSAMASLLKDTFQRAANRAAIKAERKTVREALVTDRASLLEIVTPAIAAALESSGRSTSEAGTIAVSWHETLLQADPQDAGALRVSAETAAEATIRGLTTVPKPKQVIEDLD